MERTCTEGRRSSKTVSFKGERFRSPAGTRVKEGRITVKAGPRGGSVVVVQGKVTERWYRLCA